MKFAIKHYSRKTICNKQNNLPIIEGKLKFWECTINDILNVLNNKLINTPIARQLWTLDNKKEKAKFLNDLILSRKNGLNQNYNTFDDIKSDAISRHFPLLMLLLKSHPKMKLDPKLEKLVRNLSISLMFVNLMRSVPFMLRNFSWSYFPKDFLIKNKLSVFKIDKMYRNKVSGPDMESNFTALNKMFEKSIREAKTHLNFDKISNMENAFVNVSQMNHFENTIMPRKNLCFFCIDCGGIMNFNKKKILMDTGGAVVNHAQRKCPYD
ncbi:hypothetical protein A3Q56_04303 [Intoshia linei]|uniref:Uncharacterized protein n=1 Tax=Intoshia linei TaxID=1819745 RepID=A0A177B3F8_9BILA|nr:hypothetical protein A3Q56_04303 [Intoshia linei]